MNFRLVTRILGRLCVVLGLLLLVPLAVALGYGDGGSLELLGFGGAAAVAFALGLAGSRIPRDPGELIGPAEGFTGVTLAWCVAALIGALPYYISRTIPAFTDCFFESISGFTTTGASILTDIEVLPHGILFWRSFTQWLGGMGIVALFIALLPALGAGGNFLFQAEVPGPTTDRIRPRISETAKLLWIIYGGLTVVLFGLLWLFGMTPFEAINHAFTTLSTGGFSTSNQSLGGFSPLLQWVVTAFMFLAGVNFTMHFLLLARRFRSVYENAEVRLYSGLAVGATVIVVASFWWLEPSLPAQSGEAPDVAVPAGLHDQVRHATFAVVSVMTTTGFGSHDFNRWPDLGRVLLILVMVFGGCAGSTAGGVKIARLLLLVRYVVREMRRLLHPSAILPVKIGGRIVPAQALDSTAGFFLLFTFLYVVGVLVLLALDLDTGTSLSAVIACLSNIGPGLSTVGPVENYSHLPGSAKWVLSGLMLLGRLELYSVLVLFVPQLWRK